MPCTWLLTPPVFLYVFQEEEITHTDHCCHCLFGSWWSSLTFCTASLPPLHFGFGFRLGDLPATLLLQVYGTLQLLSLRARFASEARSEQYAQIINHRADLLVCLRSNLCHIGFRMRDHQGSNGCCKSFSLQLRHACAARPHPVVRGKPLTMGNSIEHAYTVSNTGLTKS